MNTPVDGNPAVSVWQHTVGQSTLWHYRTLGRRRTDKVVVHPAAPNSGVHFVYRDSAQTISTFPAHWDAVVETRGGTALGDRSGATVRGAIPLLAALRVVGIDNALVEVHGPRIPADIGDLRNYLDLLADARVQAQPEARQVLRVMERIEVRDRYGFAALTPAADFQVSISQSPIQSGGSTEPEYAALYSDLAEPQPAEHAPAAGSRPVRPIRGGNLLVARPLREITQLPEALQVRIIELIGHLALAGAAVAGSVDASESSEAICQTLVGTMLERHVVQHTTADAHRARAPVAASDGDGPVSGRIEDSNT